MSVLIKDMEMPSCNDCPLAGDFKCNLMPSIPALCKEYDIAVQNGERLNNCPLVKIPPHGRLIDADDVFHVLTSYYHHSTDFQHEALKEALARVSTIIEAEDNTDFFTKGHLHLGRAEEGE